jgi:hypothetical protein
MKLSITGLGSLLLVLCACGEPPTTREQPAKRLPAPLAVPRPTAAPAPRYAGTYAVTDTAVCALAITITRQGQGYRFRTDQQQGPVTVTREGADTYFTFVGLKGEEPAVDIEAAWADSALLIQNYGNSMNPYQRFGQCDAKYLTLRRQQP